MSDGLAKARAALAKQQADPWTIVGSIEHHLAYEAKRRTQLLADEEHNPALYVTRQEPLPNINICRKCNVTDRLITERVGFFVVVSCPICGSCYYPDAEPIPRSDLYTSSRSGRHHTEKPGEHHLEYDASYRKNTKKRKENDATT